MIPKACKRLAEVDFPIAEVSKHSAREKSIRHGHPSTLHLWWARRPLAACRAVLLALLLPDPCDPLCPAGFKDEARALLPAVQGPVGPGDENLRRALLRFIGDFANWDLAANAQYLAVSRGLVRAAHPDETPLVVDPFAGGGSIPLEALRLGCEAFASDLNPVAVLIEKVMLEDIPRHGPELADELRRVGAEIKAAAEKELAELYPPDPDGARPIAYLWARTVRCESPNCGAEIPLVRSFWLSKKANRRRALRYRVERPKGEPPQVKFEVFEPRSEGEVPRGTVSRAKATCLCCGTVLPPERVRAQLRDQRGGADVIFDETGNRVGGAWLLAVVTLRPGKTGRHYRLPTGRDYEAVRKAHLRLAQILDEWERGGKQGLCPVPNELLPPVGTLGFRVQRYGMLQWGDLFTARQKVALRTVARAAHDRPQSGDDAIRTTMAMVVGRCADYGSSIVSWAQSGEFVRSTFGRQALPIVWDFAEAVPWSDSSGNLEGAIDWTSRVIETWPGSRSGQLQPADATEHPLPDETAHVWFTDPPYYDAVPYADLSDYFLVWLKRALPGHPLLRDAFDASNPLTPKTREAVQDETKRDNGRPKDRAWFEETMAKAFAEGRRVLREDGVGSVVFAHKTTEGWEALLSGMIRGRWTITGSWPIATERPGRLRSQDSAALATSIHLICRPRPEDTPVGDWGVVLRELPKRVAEWMDRLQAEGIRGADLVFACIGPALEIYSRYLRVETAEGREVTLAEYLEKVWEEIGRAALREILGTDAPSEFEEDARLTALFLWTMRSINATSPSLKGVRSRDFEDSGEDEPDDEGGDEAPTRRRSRSGASYSLPYDIVRRFCQPLGIHLERWEDRLIETRKGVVRLLSVRERARQILGDKTSRDLEYLQSTTADPRPYQLELFELQSDETERRQKEERTARAQRRVEGETWVHLHQDKIPVLDHVHKAMLFQKQGMTVALRELLFYEQAYRPDFLRLANALSALYPRGSEEKRLVDAMLLAVPR